jgi:hypothetical protein
LAAHSLLRFAAVAGVLALGFGLTGAVAGLLGATALSVLLAVGAMGFSLRADISGMASAIGLGGPGSFVRRQAENPEGDGSGSGRNHGPK